MRGPTFRARPGQSVYGTATFGTDPGVEPVRTNTFASFGTMVPGTQPT
jgi:hypothetical protein